MTRTLQYGSRIQPVPNRTDAATGVVTPAGARLETLRQQLDSSAKTATQRRLARNLEERHLPQGARQLRQQPQASVTAPLQMKTGVRVKTDETMEHGAHVSGHKAEALGPAIDGGTMGAPSTTEGQAAQLKGRSKNQTEVLLAEAEEQMEEEAEAQEEAEAEFWSDEDGVIDYAMDELERTGYANWDGTDSPAGSDYCRFIWQFGYGVLVGANVHYTAAGKVAGHSYIRGVNGFQWDTDAALVANAPVAKPPTTMPWP